MKINISICAVAFLTAATLAFPSEPSLIISYDNIAARIQNQNPYLAAARIRILEANGRLNQSGLLQNPEFQVDLQNNDKFNEGAFTVGFSQKFPITDRLRLEKEVSSINIQMATAEVSEKERELISESRQYLVSYLALNKRKALLQKQLKTSNELSDFIKKMTTTGERSTLDFKQARMNSLQVKTDLRQLQASEKSLKSKLKILLGMSPERSLAIGGSLEKMPIPREIFNIDKRGDVRAAKYAIHGAKKLVELEESRRYDDIEVGVFASIAREEDVPVGFEKKHIFGVGVKVPLPLWDKNEGSIEEARALVQRKNLELKALKESTLNQLKGSREEMLEWSELFNEIETTIIPEAVEHSKLANQSYKKGQIDLQTVFRTREQLLRLQNSRINALEQFHKSRAYYESTLGL